jgi:DNA polymerase-3 subunit delta
VAARRGKPVEGIFAVVGDKAYDSFTADAALAAILAAGPYAAEAVQVLRGDETTWTRVLDLARTRSLFAERRAIVVRGADGLKGEAEGIDDYLADPTPGIALVLMAAKPDRRRASWKAVMAKAEVVKADAPRGAALRALLGNQARERGLRLTGEAVEELIERVGSDPRRLVGELDKLAAFASEQAEPIGAEAVAAVLGRGRAQPLFKLSDAIGGRATGPALELMEDLLEEGEEPLRILATLYRSLRQVRAARALRDARLSREETAARLGLPASMAFKLDALLAAGRAWSDERLAGAIAALDCADLRIKSGSHPRVALLAALAGCCGEPRTWPRPER